MNYGKRWGSCSHFKPVYFQMWNRRISSRLEGFLCLIEVLMVLLLLSPAWSETGPDRGRDRHATLFLTKGRIWELLILYQVTFSWPNVLFACGQWRCFYIFFQHLSTCGRGLHRVVGASLEVSRNWRCWIDAESKSRKRQKLQRHSPKVGGAPWSEKWSQCGSAKNLHHIVWPAGGNKSGCNSEWVAGSETVQGLNRQLKEFTECALMVQLQLTVVVKL